MFKRTLNIFFTLTLFFISTTYSQTKKQTVEADVVFHTLDFFSFFAFSDSSLASMDKDLRNANIDSLVIADTLDEDGKKLVQYVQKAIRDELYKKTFITIKRDTNYNRLFIDKSDYEILTKFNYEDLVKENKKIRVKVKATTTEYMGDAAFIATERLQIKKVTGKQPSAKYD